MTTSTRKPVRVRITDAGDSIRRRETFVAGDGSLTGGPTSAETMGERGRLWSQEILTMHAAHERHGAALYVVRSYGTPIAWAGPGEPLTVPDVRYSVTTSRHQGIARRADDTPHTIRCETCGQLSARPIVSAATGRMLSANHAKVEPTHVVHVRRA